MNKSADDIANERLANVDLTLLTPPPLSVCSRCLHTLVGLHPQSGPCIVEICSCEQFQR
jgi:hypothetical protein